MSYLDVSYSTEGKYYIDGYIRFPKGANWSLKNTVRINCSVLAKNFCSELSQRVANISLGIMGLYG